MGTLVAAAAVRIREDQLKALTQEIDGICKDAGFPEGEPFKWSPGRELWMRDNLVEVPRQNFYLAVLQKAPMYSVEAAVIIEDTRYACATKLASHEDDVTALLLERVQHCLKSSVSNGIIIADRPGGREVAEHERFLAGRLEILAGGTRFVRYDRVLLLATMPSKLNRILQLADLIAGCTTSFVGGEDRYSPPIFEAIRPLLRTESDRVGGVGIKIHPDYKYCNLYHWLLADTHFYKGNVGVPLPIKNRPYATDALAP
jgi:Protein of unknown function (DUF3800)